ncbi:ABC transporter substrate-binding protein [Cupriavidus sp. amp6]|uniref:ABC transporter substrate-binding protein n=1 Tax=Cupriavidus sp. amp6 TaxID=388051 RepID=UPI0006889DBC|nr:ABC transporter substrate-binding protein [Cupriavidus sp. amp6]
MNSPHFWKQPLLGILLCGVAMVCQAASDILIGSPLDYQYAITTSTLYHQGQKDYAALLNQRGGVQGHQIRFVDADHANDAKKGIEAYERMLKDGVLAVDPLSTIVAKALTKRVLDDKVNLVSFYSGRSDASDGKVFPYVFPMSPTYWSQAALIVKHIEQAEGGNLKGKRIGYVADSNPEALGMSTLPLLEELSKKLGFTLVPALYPRTGDRTPTLEKLAEEKPDWTIVWDGGPRKFEAYNYLFSHGIRPERTATLIWLSEAEMTKISAPAIGMLKFEGFATGKGPRVIQDIIQNVVGRGLGSGPRENVGTTYYNAGVVSVAIVAEAVKQALRADPHRGVTREALRDGLQKINDFDADGLAPPMRITPEDHQGGGAGRIVRWDGERWAPISGWSSAYQDVVWDFIHRSSFEYAAKGQ